MMQLYAPLMSVQSKKFVKSAIEDFECTFNKIKVIKYMREDGFGEIDWFDLEATLNRIRSQC